MPKDAVDAALARFAELFDALQHIQATPDALAGCRGRAPSAMQAVAMSILENKYTARLNEVDSQSGLTPLVAAIKKGQGELVRLCIRFGADPGVECNIKHQNGTYWMTFALGEAAKRGHPLIVKMLLAHPGVNVNQRTTDCGSTAMYDACDCGKPRIVELLLAHNGVEVNKANREGITPFEIACTRGRTEVVAILLSTGLVEVNRLCPSDGGTPLHSSCTNGHIGVVRLLLAHASTGVNKAASTVGVHEGGTALYAACCSNRPAIIAVLLACDAVNVNAAPNGFTFSPLFAASGQSSPNVALQMLLAHSGVDVLQATDEGTTALHVAAAFGVVESVQLLVLHGASMTGLHNGITAADMATANNHALVANWLLNVAGWSQLRVAAGLRQHKAAALMLRRGKIDPDDTTIKVMMEVVATANAKPATLPWEGAPQVCKATQRLAIAATGGWHRASHWLYHGAVRRTVFTVLVVVLRLERASSLPADDHRHALPLLPIEIWTFALQFLKRSWWRV